MDNIFTEAPARPALLYGPHWDSSCYFVVWARMDRT